MKISSFQIIQSKEEIQKSVFEVSLVLYHRVVGTSQPLLMTSRKFFFETEEETLGFMNAIGFDGNTEITFDNLALLRCDDLKKFVAQMLLDPEVESAFVKGMAVKYYDEVGRPCKVNLNFDAPAIHVDHVCTTSCDHGDPTGIQFAGFCYLSAEKYPDYEVPSDQITIAMMERFVDNATPMEWMTHLCDQRMTGGIPEFKVNEEQKRVEYVITFDFKEKLKLHEDEVKRLQDEVKRELDSGIGLEYSNEPAWEDMLRDTDYTLTFDTSDIRHGYIYD